jgi:hypothetical protein
MRAIADVGWGVAVYLSWRGLAWIGVGWHY